MASSSKTRVFGGEMKERVVDRQTNEKEDYGVIYTQTAMTDYSKSCGLEIVNTASTADVITELLSSEPVQLFYSGEYKPFDAIFDEVMYAGYKNKPAFRATRLVRAWASSQPFPATPMVDVNPLYEFLPVSEGMDIYASRRLAFGVLVGSKKFALNGKEYFQFNLLQPFDDSQPNAFGYSALFGSMSKDIFFWHMKLRGEPSVVLLDGYTKIGRNHADTFFAVKLYSLEETLKLLDDANAAGGSPALPVTEPATDSTVDSISDASLSASAAVPVTEEKPAEPAEKPARNPFSRKSPDTGSNG